jgi:hypothetical protein
MFKRHLMLACRQFIKLNLESSSVEFVFTPGLDRSVVRTKLRAPLQSCCVKNFLLAGTSVSGFTTLIARAQSLPVLREQGGLIASTRIDGRRLKLRVLGNGAINRWI